LYRAATEDRQEWIDLGLNRAALFTWDASATTARAALETLRPAQ
jgi:hypothetical protein